MPPSRRAGNSVAPDFLKTEASIRSDTVEQRDQRDLYRTLHSSPALGRLLPAAARRRSATFGFGDHARDVGMGTCPQTYIG